MTQRRRFLAAGMAACATPNLWLNSAHAQASSWPSKNITLIIPTAPGGGNDTMARLIGQRLGALLGQTIVVENRAGANGSLATEAVARATADGHTLLWGYIATHSMNPALQKLRYDPIADFEPISLVGYSPTLMVANPNAGFTSVKELIAQLKAKPDRHAYASAGNGTAPHFAAELFCLRAGVKMLGVPYKGSAPAMQDTMSGQTQVMFPSLFSALQHVKTGRLRALAIAGPKRSAQLPDVPTLKELGIDGVEVQQWYGFFAPAKTPPEIVNRLHTTINRILTEDEIVKRIEGQGADVETATRAEFAALLQSELVKWRQVVASAKITPD
ncbi:MAG: Bug family tripartite tricarboxylate transporter substrate binding protein [Betaproteobacteria bacterium]